MDQPGGGMKKMLLIVILICMVFPFSAYAGDEEYDDCILLHLKGAKLDHAANLIKQACYRLYKQKGVLLEDRRLFLTCLLEHLVGIDSAQAVDEIHRACGRKYD
jgi:hypothetical protein